MKNPYLRYVTKYGVAAFSVALALAVNVSLPGPHHPSALFLAAVTVSAWYGGLGPGLCATFLATLAFDYFFLPEPYQLGLGPATWVWLATFILVAVLINSLHNLQHQLTSVLRLQDSRKSEFMAVLAHELRNFLSPMSMGVGTLRRGARDEIVEQTCSTLERQIGNMARLVSDLLDVARISQGKVVLQREVVDLAKVVAQVVQAIRPQTEAQGHHLHAELPAEPLFLEADRTRLEQVLVNLLTNAVKYTEASGHIWVTAERTGRELALCVRDTGRGIAPDVLPHVFELFAQAETGARGGLGIGLNLVKAVVEMHGGSVTAHSMGLGHGSEFVVRLPQGLPVAGHGRQAKRDTAKACQTQVEGHVTEGES